LTGAQWLNQSFGDRAMTLAAVLRPCLSELMEAHDVSTLVNSPENDTAECIEPVSPDQPNKATVAAPLANEPIATQRRS